ncbi:uncharacterized protein [Littorina saxatilis]|uniref:Uncharacterized protein n=1 Tax=Littorina saxatilis TaxID=31220 RepID=A0AAN9GI38_9CAEN
MKPCGSACFLLFAVVCAATWNSASAGTKTVAGANCAPDHQCGTHNENYFWCYKDLYGARSSEWDYCCKPDHPCGTYGSSYNWCNNGYSWSYCHKEEVTSRKTVSGKSCSPNHSCGQHGYSYNWCYVPGSWEYCCKPDHACGKHGQSYDWCWFGSYATSWRQCKA